MYAPKPARTTHQHPAHIQGQHQFKALYGFTSATIAGLIALGMLTYAIWETTR